MFLTSKDYIENRTCRYLEFNPQGNVWSLHPTLFPSSLRSQGRPHDSAASQARKLGSPLSTPPLSSLFHQKWDPRIVLPETIHIWSLLQFPLPPPQGKDDGISILTMKININCAACISLQPSIYFFHCSHEDLLKTQT